MVVDFFTRWPVAIASGQHGKDFVWQLIEKHITSKFGKPVRILPNCVQEFVSKKMKLYFNNKKIDYLTKTLYHIQNNGRVERLNRALMKIMKKLTIENLSMKFLL